VLGRREVHRNFWWGNLKDANWKEQILMEDRINLDLQEIIWDYGLD